MNFFYKKYSNFFLKKIIYGYRKIKLKKNSQIFSLLNDDLTKYNFNKINYQNFFFGDNYENINKSINQKMLKEIAGYRLQKFILFFLSINFKLCYPLTIDWIRILEKNNIKVNKFASIILWRLFLIYKIFITFKLLVSVIVYNFLSKNNDSKNQFYYFFNLSKDNIPKTNKEYLNYGIFDSVNFIENTNILNLKHDLANYGFKNDKINVEYSKFFFLPNQRIIFNIKIIIWFVINFFVSIYGLFFSWKYPFLFNDCLLAYIIKNVRKKDLAYNYFFNQSAHIYKPYWTYIAEKRNCRIIFYFYSTNIIELSSNNMNIPDYLGWKSISWNNFYFWNNNQKNYIQKFINNFNYKITGPINFLPTIKNNHLQIKEKYVLVFDIRPSRLRLYSFLGKPFDFYTASNTIKFINDIYEITKKHKIKLIIKQKRLLAGGNKLEDPRYYNFLKKISRNLDVNIYYGSEGDGLNDIIKNSLISVSMPYTSTAIISKNINYNTIYYDPTGKLRNDKIITNDVLTINTKDNLIEYFKNKL